MEFEQFKDSLERGRKLQFKIAEIEDRIREQRFKASYKNSNCEAIRGSNANHFENALDRLIHLQEKLNRYRVELKEYQDYINRILQLDELSITEKRVFKLRYLDGLSWHDIEDDMHWKYNSKRCFQVNSSALQKIFLAIGSTFSTFST